MYKLIALDMDGTLLNSEKQITDRTKKTLAQARAKGVKIVLASGRPLAGLQPPLKELDLINIPLFNFFIKANTNETLSVMTYETNSKIEAALDTLTVFPPDSLLTDTDIAGIPLILTISESSLYP